MEKLKPTWLLDYKKDVYSQTGEDGIIEKILEVIGSNDKWAVEFGAWDGVISNTQYLIESKQYKAVLIEADKKRFLDLKRIIGQNDNIIPINQFVEFKKDNNLDHILSNTPIPLDYDLLSIDIDGNDFHVWKATKKYSPKVVIIEFNPTIPTHISFVQTADKSVNQGTSLLSLVQLGKEKGYELVSVLWFNAVFVKKEYFHLFQIEFNDPEILRTNLDSISYIFQGYDGHVFLQGNCKLGWHGIDFKESKIQQLPSLLRKYPPNYSILEKIIFGLFLLFTNRRLLLQKIKRQFKLF
jgi:hypothetical protein